MTILRSQYLFRLHNCPLELLTQSSVNWTINFVIRLSLEYIYITSLGSKDTNFYFSSSPPPLLGQNSTKICTTDCGEITFWKSKSGSLQRHWTGNRDFRLIQFCHKSFHIWGMGKVLTIYQSCKWSFFSGNKSHRYNSALKMVFRYYPEPWNFQKNSG